MKLLRVWLRRFDALVNGARRGIARKDAESPNCALVSVDSDSRTRHDWPLTIGR